MTTTPLDLTVSLIEYEAGNLDAQDVVVLFSRLIQTGLVNHLQGSYGRMAADLIRAGWLDRDGNILRNPEDF